jgi:hypothetical protein
MMTDAKAARRWLAVLVLGALVWELLGSGATAAMAPLLSQPVSADNPGRSEALAPARLLARLIELEAANEQLAAELARARRELSEL